MLRSQLPAAQAGSAGEVAEDAREHAHAHDARSNPNEGWNSPTAQVHWFSDVGVQTSSRPGMTTSFGLGQLDLFLTSRLTDDLSVLSEIVFRAQSDNRMVVNPERLLVQYTPFDAMQLAAGRFHSAVGFYNAAYHHGSWFETAATRPSIFSAGLIPVHNVGVSLTGAVPSGPLGLRYIAEIGNGQTSRATTLEPTQNVTDENNTKAMNVGVLARPVLLPGFQAGLSWYHDRLSPQGLPRVRQDVIATHAVYQTGGTELLNEVVVVRDTPDGGVSETSYGWYSQWAHRFGAARPYFRYQLVKGDADDPLFRTLGTRHGPVFGLRYELGRFAALKLQYERALRRNASSSHEAAIKLAFTF